jgi:hypothetical protein
MTKLSVVVTPFSDAHWKSPAVSQLVAKDALLAPLLEKMVAESNPIASTTEDIGPEWKEVMLDVPSDGSAIDHYVLGITQPSPGVATWWYDSVRFATVWGRKSE